MLLATSGDCGDDGNGYDDNGDGDDDDDDDVDDDDDDDDDNDDDDDGDDDDDDDDDDSTKKVVHASLPSLRSFSLRSFFTNVILNPPPPIHACIHSFTSSTTHSLILPSAPPPAPKSNCLVSVDFTLKHLNGQHMYSFASVWLC